MVPAHVMLFSVSPVVWITVIIVLVVVFGAAKLPDIARNVGKSAKVLKEELNDLTDDGKAVESAEKSEKKDADGGAAAGGASDAGESK